MCFPQKISRYVSPFSLETLFLYPLLKKNYLRVLLDYKNMYLFGQGIDDPSSIRIACGAHNMLLKEPSPLDRSIIISGEGLNLCDIVTS